MARPTYLHPLTHALTLALAFGAAACRRGSDRPASGMAPATGLPASFTPVEWAPPPAAAPGTAQPERCALVLRDERDGTRLQLMRSASTAGRSQRGDTTVTTYGATGDYAIAPTGRYGAKPGQWLRVECGTWRGLGLVPVSE